MEVLHNEILRSFCCRTCGLGTVIVRATLLSHIVPPPPDVRVDAHSAVFPLHCMSPASIYTFEIAEEPGLEQQVFRGGDTR
jgi:hypothetical protein